MSANEEKIAQAIWIVLTTAPGERVMRPDFGCGINALVFSNINDATIGEVVNAVSVALAQWEPRIDVIGVAAEASDEEPNLLLISIDYQVRSTNSRFNLVYPFYTE